MVTSHELDTTVHSRAASHQALGGRVNFTVPGAPAPQGSKRHIGRGILIESSRRVGPWRERIALAAHNATCGAPLLDGAISVELQFVLPRPKSTPKRRTPAAIHRPDIDKLVRAVLDALTNTIIRDDAQITQLRATKRLAELNETAHAQITLYSDES